MLTIEATEAGYVDLDTARVYSPHAPGTSEPILGKTDFKEWAVMDTKIPPVPGSGAREKVAESVRASLEALGVEKVSRSECGPGGRMGGGFGFSGVEFVAALETSLRSPAESCGGTDT
jgi:hypothetical protein